jgi:hypothetical protein
MAFNLPLNRAWLRIVPLLFLIHPWSLAGEGLDFIIDYTFLERFYSGFYSGKHCIGLATTPFSTVESD